ncbi:hypothetical protein VQ042_20990 [Aurantimonas sp. A2-1-M11]|uniref:hypothetical protein n=1 Tax=Aurantimonas sp. A2-1-M11 TaxID=3113712 RepID=UPI002F935BB1
MAVMTTGLDSFDNFTWASLLAGRDVLVLDPDPVRGLKSANALDAAGARATLTANAEAARDRLLRRTFVLALVALPGEADLDDGLDAAFDGAGIRLLLLVDRARRGAVRARHPEARIASLELSERELVMLLNGTADE